MRIVVIPGLCDGNGLCVREAPDLLAVDDNDEVQVLTDSFGTERLDAAKRAVQVCPKAALRIDGKD